MSSRKLLPAAALLLAVACGGGGPAASIQPAGQTTAAPVASAAPSSIAEVAMCTLMPLGDVRSLSPFSTPLAEAVPGTTSGMCEYRSASDADEPVGVLLVVTDFGSVESAQTHMAAYRANMTTAGVVLWEVGGVGDEAVTSGVDEVGVHAIAGRYALDANLGGEWPDTSDAAKVSAGTNLLRTVITRLP